MLALFEVLSFKGWLDVRDILIKALGPVSFGQDVKVLHFNCYNFVAGGKVPYEFPGSVQRCAHFDFRRGSRHEEHSFHPERILAIPKEQIRLARYCSGRLLDFHTYDFQCERFLKILLKIITKKYIK
ncbi:unnamed protein product [Nesidiocoris tenuis]|uniref:Uncharacterized protein n=1 Tax=Nesidiocoris tenuis TaxID=355587 RepID=A0A6H5FWW5_9HEMI|nr:unnamed protein product [Nesidiocoris tenuis]